MKKIVCFLLFSISLNSFAQQDPIGSKIEKTYGEVLEDVREYTKLENLHAQLGDEKFPFYIVISPGSDISSDIIEQSKDKIIGVFKSFSRNHQDDSNVARKPTFKDKKDDIFTGVQTTIASREKIYYIAFHELNINKTGENIKISADKVILFEYGSHHGWRDQTFPIDHTEINIAGKFVPDVGIGDIVEVDVVTRVDDLISDFRRTHDRLKGRIDGKNYVQLNEKIYDNIIENKVRGIIPVNKTERFRNFLTRFLGNAKITYYDSIPINTQQQDYYRTNRIQSGTLSDFENYSLYGISGSQKEYEGDDEIKFNFPEFYHWLVIKDNLFYNLLIFYPSEKYRNDLEGPLIRIFDNEGEKFTHDIYRFFYGFTTALTIQDIDWIDEFYHDMAIRNFFPGESTSRNGTRIISVTSAQITEGYRSLKNKEREVYVTLNEGDIEQPVTYVWLDKGYKELRYLNDTILSKLPAFVLKLKMEQKWRTLNREDQQLTLNDQADIDFTLLCMNIKELKIWLNKISFDNTDQITIFTLESYLQDLWKDMNSNEKTIFKTDYKKLHQYLDENRQTLSNIEMKKREDSITSEDFEEIGQAFNNLSSLMRFENVLSDIRNFFSSNLRNEVHNRRFLFNVCYLKIINQYTYDNDGRTIRMEPTNFEYLRRLNLF